MFPLIPLALDASGYDETTGCEQAKKKWMRNAADSQLVEKRIESRLREACACKSLGNPYD